MLAEKDCGNPVSGDFVVEETCVDHLLFHHLFHGHHSILIRDGSVLSANKGSSLVPAGGEVAHQTKGKGLKSG